jgi:glucose/arabinose dehydrogenase
MRKLMMVGLLIAALGLLAAPLNAQDGVLTRSTPPDAAQFQLVQVATGFPRALHVTNAGDGTDRLFVVQQNGVIRALDADRTPFAQPFLDVSALISADALGNGYTERGLLGLAFHPNYAENGTFFINYTEANSHDSIVARYQVSEDPNIADPASAVEVMRVAQPFGNHNGGHIDFGPDGYLYISLGDGGSQGDPMNNGQQTSTLLATILRIDVDGGTSYAIPADNPFADGVDGAPEVWAYGLRNPWRFSFDPLTGDMYIGDVGQNRWEEINFQPAGIGGLNYGWNAFEASYPYSGAAVPANAISPVAEYQHAGGHCSVTAGQLYRGESVPTLQRAFVYGDFCSGQLWAVYRDDSGAWMDVQLNDTSFVISSFGVDEAGELYLVDYGQGGAGTIYQFVAVG